MYAVSSRERIGGKNPEERSKEGESTRFYASSPNIYLERGFLLMLKVGNLPIALTVHQAAELLNLCDRTVYRMCVDGELKAVKLRKSWRINRDAVLQLLGTEAE